MREEMGMQLLREKFPDVPDDVFRAKHLTKARLVPGRPGRFPGTHSMLDVVMQGPRSTTVTASIGSPGQAHPHHGVLRAFR